MSFTVAGGEYNFIFFFLKLCREKIYQNLIKKIYKFKITDKILDIGTSPVNKQISKLSYPQISI